MCILKMYDYMLGIDFKVCTNLHNSIFRHVCNLYKHDIVDFNDPIYFNHVYF